MYQFGLRDAQIASKTLPPLCLWKYLGKRLVFESSAWVNKLTLSNLGVHHTMRHLREQKWGGIFPCLLEMGHVILLSLDISVPGSWAFRLRLNYTAGFPGSSACRQCIVEFLSLLNRVNLVSLSILLVLPLESPDQIQVSGVFQLWCSKVSWLFQGLCWIEVVIMDIVLEHGSFHLHFPDESWSSIFFSL